MSVTATAASWDARAEIALAAWMRHYLACEPPPSGAALAEDFRCSARNLAEEGERRLAGLGERALRGVT